MGKPMAVPNAETLARLIDLALDVRANAYAPYSHFAVGAALLCGDGSIYVGANAENASYPAGICAERAALFAAVSAGKRDFTAIIVCGGAYGQQPDKIITPCGICRQALAELCPGDMPVICAAAPHEYKLYTLSELLPDAFDSVLPDMHSR